MVHFMLSDKDQQGLTPLVRTPDYTDDVLHSKISTLVYVLSDLGLFNTCLISLLPLALVPFTD